MSVEARRNLVLGVFGDVVAEEILQVSDDGEPTLLLDLSRIRANDLADVGRAEHVVLGVENMAGVRQLLPLTRHLGAKRLTVVIRRAGGGWIAARPWEPVRVGDSLGARLRLSRTVATDVHDLLAGALIRDGGTRAPARGLRVGIHERAGEAWLSGDPNALHLRADDLVETLVSDVAALGDVVIADREAAGKIAALEGAPPVIRVAVTWEPGHGTRGPSWAELAVAPPRRLSWPPPNSDAKRGKLLDVSPLPPVDTASVNPVGFQSTGTDGFADVQRAGDQLRLKASRWSLDIGQGASLSPEQIELLRGVRGVTDCTTAHRGPLEHARMLSQLGVAGVPTIVDRLPEAVRMLLGDDLTDLIEATDAQMLKDDFWREASSVATRRAALRAHSGRERWAGIARRLPFRAPPTPTVSVVLATRRPELVAHAVAQVELQQHIAVELVLALHGDDFQDDAVERIAASAAIPVEVLRVSESVVFGDVLNEATERCSGDFVAKMDDDDWYGPEHLWDLYAAIEYSGATLAGRPADFIHIDGIDVTVRRQKQGSERMADQVAGGTLLLSRHDLAAVGGWRPVPRSVDRFLCQEIRASGGGVYRQHAFGYLLSRRAGGHTWDSKPNRFLRSSVSQWRGRRLDMATADLLWARRSMDAVASARKSQ